MCQKIAFADKGAAKEYAHHVTHYHKFRSKKMSIRAKANKKTRVYQCNFCGCWHMTTQKPKSKKRASA